MHVLKEANANHIWTVLCQSATIDEKTNDLTLTRAIDELAVTFPKPEALQAFSAQAAKKPVAAPMPCELVTLWKKVDRSKKSDFDSRVTYHDPEGKALQTVEIPVSMEPGKFRHRSRLSVPAIPMTMPGEYTFVVEAKARDADEKAYVEVARIPLDISFKLEGSKNAR